MAGTKKSGRKPKPTAQKKLEGNPGKRALNRDEPVFDSVTENILPPDDFAKVMGEVALNEWMRLAPSLAKNRILTSADLVALASYCMACEDLIESRRLIQLNGLVYETTNKEGLTMQRKSPMFEVAHRAKQTILSFMSEFGLTPATRSKIIVPGVEQEEDPMEGLLKRVK